LTVDGGLPAAPVGQLLVWWNDVCRRVSGKDLAAAPASGKPLIRGGEASGTLRTYKQIVQDVLGPALSPDRANARKSERCRLPSLRRCRRDNDFPIA
jgi:hypothetical protein